MADHAGAVMDAPDGTRFPERIRVLMVVLRRVLVFAGMTAGVWLGWVLLSTAATPAGAEPGTAAAGRHAGRTPAAPSARSGQRPGEPLAPYPAGPDRAAGDSTAAAGYSASRAHDRTPPARPGAAAGDPLPA